MSDHQQSPIPDTDGAALLQAILDSAVDGIITVDERGIIESANPAVVRLFGYSLNEMLGQNIKMLMPTPYRDEHDQYLANYLTTGVRKIIGIGREVEGRRKDGTVFPLYLSVSEVQLGSRRLFTGIIHDLADLRGAELAATRIGRVLEDSLNEIYVFDAVTLKFELVNRGARENLGYSMEELRSLTPIDLKPEIGTERFQEILAKLRSGESESVQFETIHQRKDRTTYPVEVHLQFSRSVGKAAFVAMILDITERKQADSERSRLHAELEARVQELRIRDQAIQSAGEGVVIADARQPDFPIVFVNAAFESLSGYTADEVMGQHCCLLHGDDQDQAGLATLRDALEQSRPCHVTVRNYRKDGTMFWNEISVAPVRDADGDVTHMVGVMDDVTDRRENHKRMVQTERLAAIGEMVTGLAHESRNALQRAQACLDMLSLDLEEQPEQLDLTNRTMTALDDLHRLYEEVKDYAAPIQLQRKPSDLSVLWRTVWNNLQVSFGDRTIELTERLHGVDLHCRIDPFRIEQVFRNILENAIAVCPQNGSIEIDCAEVDHNARLCVQITFRDNGPGFPESARDFVFQPFFTTKQKGTGLGMAIAKRIVEAHEGRICIGQGRDSGAEIIVILPR